ncbi:MAG: fumarylacetoacetate hydrolase family protein [Alphaproteobacteria bacterium]|jgi:2-keto-4-pentenoate hydratase|nr:fumarylacetoacetate hydrolase family protein [Alphaproteobacteria bacterium]MDP6814570.1 fumarylacetoacetate hydrolase family protein [Alphaproteobacteria bacterium]
MAETAIEAAARKLFADTRAGRQGTPLPAELTPPDMTAAYAVQDRLQALWQDAGAGPVAGWKVALTSKVMQELVGVDEPCEGAVFANRVYRHPATVAAGDFINLGVEAEIAVRLGRDLPASDGPYDRHGIGESVAACMAAIELVDDRAFDYGLMTAPLLVAENSFNAGCVLGPEVTAWRQLDLAAVPGRMLIDGEVVGEGVGGDALGHPFEPLAWLANNLNRRGGMLRAGQVVLTGSIVATKWLQAGDRMQCQVDGLGEAELTVS